MRTIHKYSKSISEYGFAREIIFELPIGALPISVINQKEFLCIYCIVDNQETDKFKKSFLIFETGSDIGMTEYIKFLGTVSFDNGDHIVHVFEK